MRDRSAQVDLALAFAATFVITLSIWPMSAPRQVVRCNADGQTWKTFSIALDDPNLQALKDKVERWSTPELHPQYVTAKWQKEVAEFYENCQPCDSQQHQDDDDGTSGPATATISDTVTTASYEVPQNADQSVVRQASLEETPELAEATRDRAADEADGDYWSTVKASAIKSMEAIEKRSANVPVVFEHVTRPSWPQLAFHFAFLFGLTAACGYMHWLRLSPIRKDTSFADQPLRVLVRIGTFSGLNLLAVLCALTLLIA